MFFWAGASFVWLMPVAPIFFRILGKEDWAPVALMVFGLFAVWFLFRLLRAVKVVFHLSFLKSLFLFIVVTTVLVGGLSIYYDKRSALFDYAPMYWRVIEQKITGAS